MSEPSPSNTKNNGNNILCANCGCTGHVYRACSLPTTSFGVVCFRWTRDVVTGERAPQYLMVQRKDSLCFVEFVRGKFDLQNRTYLMQLFESMTLNERERIRTCSFHDLWFGFWQVDHSRGYAKEFHQAQAKFEILHKGYYVRKTSTDGKKTPNTSNTLTRLTQQDYASLEFVDVDTLLEQTTCENDEPEWGFPKGRRNINEKDLKCAMREFREETGIDPHLVHVHACIKPFEEVFTGCNKVRYRHVYYLVQLKQEDDALITGAVEDVTMRGDRSQFREISRVSWLRSAQVHGKIRARNVERHEMFKRVDAVVNSSMQQTRMGWVVG